MSFNIPSEREEADVLQECARIQDQLARIDNPYGLTVDSALCEMCVPPPPLMEGQAILWRRYDRFGRVVQRDEYVAYPWKGGLAWGYPRP